jgi:hypothetical protein
MSVTRLGVSVEKVVATIETPSSLHGMLRPARKNSVALEPARRVSSDPTVSESATKARTTAQSMAPSLIATPVVCSTSAAREFTRRPHLAVASCR